MVLDQVFNVGKVSLLFYSLICLQLTCITSPKCKKKNSRKAQSTLKLYDDYGGLDFENCLLYLQEEEERKVEENLSSTELANTWRTCGGGENAGAGLGSQAQPCCEGLCVKLWSSEL